MVRLKVFLKEYFFNLAANLVAASDFLPKSFRKIIYKMLCFRLDNEALIFSRCHFRSNKLKLGTKAIIQQNCWIDNYDWVILDENAVVGHNVKIITVDHDYSNKECRCGALCAKPIKIEKGAWVGAGVTILPGITIGAGAVIAAGAVVTKSIPAYELWGGVPATYISTIDRSIEQ